MLTSANRRPEKVYTDSVPVKVYTDSVPVKVYTDSVPVKVYTDSEPVKVYTDSVPVYRDNVMINKCDDEYCSSLDSTYKMDYPEKGFALIINNEASFSNNHEISREEVYAMTKTLKDFNFKVITRSNLKVCDIRQIFNDLSKMDQSKCACFICVILTRGSRPDIIRCSDDSVSLTELLPMFLPNNCPTLIDKPKLFFIQSADILADSAYNLQHYSERKVPVISLSEDFLISSCTVSSERCYGSFIKILSDKLELYGTKKELQNILIQVNILIAKFKKNGLRILVPSVHSTLTKELTF